MRILKDFKMPNFKFPKIEMKGIENIDEVKVDYDALKKKNETASKVKQKGYEPTQYATIKEVFHMAKDKYADNVFILEKFNPKEAFQEITYREFAQDVMALGTALTQKYHLKDERVVIIGENTYHWYVSYMAMLCGVGIAVPVDKELPPMKLKMSSIVLEHPQSFILPKRKM